MLRPATPSQDASPAEVAPAQLFELRIFQALRQIIRSANLYSKHLVATADLTASQLACLWCVTRHGPMTAAVIGREIHISASTLVGILERLEAKGLVQRERDPNDRRVLRVSATEKGAALAGTGHPPMQQSLREAVNALPELEQAAIALSLERIVELMEQRRPPPGADPTNKD